MEKENARLAEITPEQVFAPGSLLRVIYADQHRPLQFKARVSWSEPGFLGLDMPVGWWRLRTENSGPQTVHLLRFYLGGLYSQEAVIREERPQETRGLLVALSGGLKRSQRRQYFRVPLEVVLNLREARLPDGEVREGLRLVLEDVSAGGAGIRAQEFLAPGCRLLLKQAPALPGGLQAVWPLELEVVWCRAHPHRGFRVGTRFVFSRPQEQDALARLVNRLQLKRRTAYYHLSADDTWAA